MSGSFTFQSLVEVWPLAPDPPLRPEAPLEELLPPDVLERSALLLLPALELPKRSGLLLLLDEPRLAPDEELAEFAPELLEPVPELLEPVPELLLPIPELELEPASLRGEELLEEPLPVLEPVPVLLPDAPPALDSRTSDTITSGATSVGGNVTIATANPF